MRYLQVPSRFHFTTPSLFRRRSSDEKGGGNSAATGYNPRSMQQRPGPRPTAGRGFAVKFYDILEKESSDIITWTQSGQAFQVLDYTRFSEEILLKYFRHNKFSSFRRQLNLYGYRKVIKGPDAGAYMHPSFQRGRRDLLGEVKKGKVPHYDIHGVNEIHGQHFRHHPPGAKLKENAVGGKAQLAQLSPALDSQSSPVVTPEIRGEDGYRNLAAHGAPAARMMGSPPPQPVPHMTPGTQAASALSNMSLSPMPHQNSTWGPPPTQPGHMDALTLTPAWGGAAGNTGPEGDAAGGSSKGKQAEEGKVGGDGGGGGGGGACANETNPPVPLAYWEKARRRRTMSAQLVFPLQPPQNTAAIDQGDPSLCDVMDVICQCMEVRSSSESQQSQLSTLSGCSFKMDPMRRTSITDLLSVMSWESALRSSGTFRGSLAGPVDPTMFDGDSGDGGRTLGVSGGVDSCDVNGSSGNSNSGNNKNSNNNNTDNAVPPRPTLEQQASFDPMREPSGVTSGLISDMAQPAVIAASPLSSAGGAPRDHGVDGVSSRIDNHHHHHHQQDEARPASRPSFDPNRQSSIADGIRAAGGGGGGAGSPRISGPAGGGGARGAGPPRPVSGNGVSQAAFISGVAGAAGGGTASQSGSMSRESSRGSTAKRIFKSAPPPARRTAVCGTVDDSGRFHEGWATANGSGRVNSADSTGTVGPPVSAAVDVPAARPDSGSNSNGSQDPVHWVLPSSQAVASASGAGGATAAVASPWGLPPPDQLRHLTGPPREQQEGDGRAGLGGGGGMASAVTTSSASSSPSTQGAQVFSRPQLGRMGSLQWLTEPTPSRRPTMNENHEVQRLLSNQANFEAWTRVADDPDSIMLAKNIGDFLG